MRSHYGTLEWATRLPMYPRSWAFLNPPEPEFAVILSRNSQFCRPLHPPLLQSHLFSQQCCPRVFALSSRI